MSRRPKAGCPRWSQHFPSPVNRRGKAGLQVLWRKGGRRWQSQMKRRKETSDFFALHANQNRLLAHARQGFDLDKSLPYARLQRGMGHYNEWNGAPDLAAVLNHLRNADVGAA